MNKKYNKAIIDMDYHTILTRVTLKSVVLERCNFSGLIDSVRRITTSYIVDYPLPQDFREHMHGAFP